MGIQNNQQPLNVYLSNISPHSQAILEFFIGSTGGKSFSLVSTPADAEVYITDFDFPGSKDHWEAEHAISAKPCIVLSMENPNNPHVQWVAKPITAQALIAAAKTISNKIHSGVDITTSVEKPTKEATTLPPPPLPRSTLATSPFSQKSVIEPPLVKSKVDVLPRKPTQTPSSIAKSIATEDLDDGDTSVVVRTPKSTTTTTSKTKVAIPSSNKTNQDIKSKGQVNKTTQALKEEPEKTSKEVSIARAEKAKKRWELLCGTKENIAALALKKDESLIYNSEHYFQGTLIAALRLAKQTGQVVQIKYAPHQFYICHHEYLVFSPLAPQSDEYAQLCHTLVKPGQVNLHILTGTESEEIRKRIHSEDAQFTYNLESFVWTSCLLTSKGRVPTSLDCDDQFLLKYWPNFTRIENFPFAMKVAATWQKKPYKLNEIAREMDVPLRYVIALYNACIGLSLFETDSSKVQQKTTYEPKKKSGLIARLFGRLIKSEPTS